MSSDHTEKHLTTPSPKRGVQKALHVNFHIQSNAAHHLSLESVIAVVSITLLVQLGLII